MSEELKPCPFCGDTEELTIVRINDSAEYWCIGCESCDYNQFIPGTKEEAVKTWNNRPIEDEKDKQIAELKAELSRNADEGYVGFMLGIEQMKKKLAEKDKVIARLKGNWDYLKEYLVALRNSILHEENLLSSEMNRYNILFLDGVIEKMNTANSNVGSMEEEK